MIKPLRNAQRLLDSIKEKFSRGIAKPLGNAQFKQIPMGY
jgi:hypothetical protein